MIDLEKSIQREIKKLQKEGKKMSEQTRGGFFTRLKKFTWIVPKKTIAATILSSIIGGLTLAPPIGAGIIYVAAPVLAKIQPEEERIISIPKAMKSDIQIFARDTTYLDSFTDKTSEETKLEALGYSKINPFLTVATLAAEDREFRTHHGLSYLGLTRALYSIEAKKIFHRGREQGGSTILVQLAKLLSETGKTEGYRSKIYQYIDAARMDQQLSKDEVLATFLNRIHVAGEKGKGGTIGVAEALKHDFNIPQDKATLLEAIVFAAQLKGRAEYNTTGSNGEKNKENMKKLKARALYVLKGMDLVFPDEVKEAKKRYEGTELDLELKNANFGKAEEYLNKGRAGHGQGEVLIKLEKQREKYKNLKEQAGEKDEEAKYLYEKYKEAYEIFRKEKLEKETFLKTQDTDISFDKTERSSTKGTLQELIQRELRELEDKKIITLPLPPGTKIFTTIDQEMHNALHQYLEEQASYVSINLEGYELPRGVKEEKLRRFKKFSSYDVKITGKNEDALFVKAGTLTGTVSRDGLKDVVLAEASHERKKLVSEREAEKDISHFLRKFKVGDLIHVSTRTLDEEGKSAGLTLLQYPVSLQGAGIIIGSDGGIRAVAGNVYDKGKPFNHLIAGKQPGSAFKPVIYKAAFELGWTETSLLNNAPRNFPFEAERVGGKTIPKSWKPGINLKELESARSTIIKACQNSENAASADLYEKLFDKVDDEQFKGVVENLEYHSTEKGRGEPFLKKEEETEVGYARRMKQDLTVGFDGWQTQVFVPMTKFNVARRRLLHTLPEAEELSLVHYGYHYEELITEIREKIAHLQLGDLRIEKLREMIPLTKLNYRYLQEHLEGIEATIEEIKHTSNKGRFNELVRNYLYQGEQGIVYCEDELQLPRISPEELSGLPNLEDTLKTEEVLINNHLKIKYAKKLLEEAAAVNFDEPTRFGIISQHPNFQWNLVYAYVKRIAEEKGIFLPERGGPATTLGVHNLSPESLATFYSFQSKYLVEKMTSIDGTIIYSHTQEERPTGKRDMQLVNILRSVPRFGTAKSVGGGRYEFQRGELVFVPAGNYHVKTPDLDDSEMSREQPFTAFKTGTTNGAEIVSSAGYYADTQNGEVSLEDLGTFAVFVSNFIGREAMYRTMKGEETRRDPQPMKYGSIDFYGGSVAGVIAFNTIKTRYPVTNDLKISGAQVIVIDPETGLAPRNCENTPTEESAYCIREGKVSGLLKVYRN